MANLVYGITIDRKLFHGKIIKSSLKSMISIKTVDNRILNFPKSHKLFKTKEERDIEIFLNNNNLSIDKVAELYNINKKEAILAYQSAIKKFPEKFI